MVVDFKFNTGETVFYVVPFKLAYTFEVRVGKIFGFSYTERRNGADIRVNFKQENGVPIEDVFYTQDEAEKRKDEHIKSLKEYLESR